MKKPQATSDNDLFLVAQLAAAVSIGSFFYYLRQGDLLLYGDAVAHINIARRVFDSQQPGPVQLGTVWLPLPHLLIMPFIVSDWAWQTGVGGAIASLAAYVFGALGIFRLVRVRVGRKTAWLAAIGYIANPNLVYLQTTAMTESLYLALFIWTVVFVSGFFLADGSGDQLKARRHLRFALLTSVGMVLTRYDGWFAAFAVALVLLASTARQRQPAALRWQYVVRAFVLPLALV